MGRTRKTIVALSAGLVGVLIMAGVAAASRGSEHPLTSARPLEHASRSSDDVTSSSTEMTTLAPGVSTTSEAEHAQPEPGDDNGNDAAAGEPTTLAPGDMTTSTGEDTSTSVLGETSTSMPEETSTTLARSVNGERTFSVAGGTLVVDVENQALTLVSVTPNPGVEVKDQRVESDRIEVEFRAADSDSRVRVRLDNGRLRVETGDN